MVPGGVITADNVRGIRPILTTVGFIPAIGTESKFIEFFIKKLSLFLFYAVIFLVVINEKLFHEFILLTMLSIFLLRNTRYSMFSYLYRNWKSAIEKK